MLIKKRKKKKKGEKMMGKYFVDETETKTFMNAVFLLTAKQSL